ncbi:MAG: fibronectin type III domain-containing protein [Candidatus Aminicenantes bacterium]
MKKFFCFFLISFLLFLSSYCGKKGPIHPPVIQIPQPPENFSAIQRADKVILEWNNPATYVDGSSLEEIKEVEIWMAVQKGVSSEEKESKKEKKISVRKFEEMAEILASIKREEFSEYQIEEGIPSPRMNYIFPLAETDVFSKKLTFGLKIIDRKRNKSGFSELLSVEPEVLPLPPENLRSTVFVDHIKITWDSPEKNIDQSTPARLMGYNIYRTEEGTEPQRLNSSLITEKEYDDHDFLFGEVYFYFVRASATTSEPYLESDDSKVHKVSAQDTFPPEAPSGLVSVVGEQSIALSWDQNQEEDLAGYRIWRKGEGEEEYFLLTPEPIQQNTYMDNRVENNKIYHYSITAVDKKGNESQRSESISEIIKDVF